MDILWVKVKVAVCQVLGTECMQIQYAITCRLTAKNRDQLRNPALGNRVWATFTFFAALSSVDFSRICSCNLVMCRQKYWNSMAECYAQQRIWERRCTGMTSTTKAKMYVFYFPVVFIICNLHIATVSYFLLTV